MAAPERTTVAEGIPSAEELMLLLEQQDVMLESLVDEVADCKRVITDLTVQITEKNEVPITSKAQMCEMRRDIAGALKTIDELRDQKKALEAEVDRLKSSSDSPTPLKAVDDLRTQMREAEFERDRMARELAAERADGDRLRSRVEELEKAVVSVESARRKWEAESAVAARETRATVEECRFRAEEAEQSLQQLQHQSAAVAEVVQQRAEHAEKHARKCQDEFASLRKERAALLARVDFLTRETNDLRTKLLQAGVGGLSSSNGPDDQTRRLLRDQAELIRTLKEECRLLAERLEEQAGRHKSITRELRRNNKELEQRIEKLLKI
ncbi:hypothetical protein PRIPAC_75069 [Pristionchus pacificus]|uniref:Uncharacterized protein n=1 Tax=Pristionchus pacificus TaxID=54126 RepID=A0A2A6CSU2_PRIPA|nr:hypothetical protein PRIPAC_75069 [Pristionchus pacificus]|eukprot:PDM81209.1 hypothetical protein PRIPAC_36212 [Pristionchus pacificus]